MEETELYSSELCQLKYGRKFSRNSYNTECIRNTIDFGLFFFFLVMSLILAI